MTDTPEQMRQRIVELEGLLAAADFSKPLTVSYTELGKLDDLKLYAFLMEGDPEDGVYVAVDEEPTGTDVPSPRLEAIAALVNAAPFLLAASPPVSEPEHKCYECDGELSIICTTCNPLSSGPESGEPESLHVTETCKENTGSFAIDEKALEKAARAMWDNHRHKYPKDSLIQGEFGDYEDRLGFLYHRFRGYARAAITALYAARAEAGFVEVPRILTYEMMNAYPEDGPSLYLLAHYASSQCNSHEENMKSVNDAYAAMLAKAK